MDDIFLWVIAVLCVIGGMIGTLMPVMPGALLVFGGLWLAAWIEHFAFVGWKTLLVLGIMAGLTYAVDFFSSMLGAKRFGASASSITGSAVGAIVGLFFGLPGILLGPFLGAVAGEFYVRKNLRQATHAGIGATLGMIIGSAFKLALVMSMVGIFGLTRWLSA